MGIKYQFGSINIMPKGLKRVQITKKELNRRIEIITHLNTHFIKIQSTTNEEREVYASRFFINFI